MAALTSTPLAAPTVPDSLTSHVTAPALPLPLPELNPVDAILQALGQALTGGVQSLASWAFENMTAALLATTAVDPGGWFDAPWRAMLAVAATLALPILLIGVASEALAGRPGAALRRGVLLPLVLAPTLLAARALLGLALGLVNGACALVVQLGIGGPDGFARALDRMRGGLGIALSPATDGLPGGPVATGVPLIVVVLIVACLSFVIWVELAVRAALVYLLAAFVPLALAGLFWSGTARWTRRLLEVLVAVVLSQLVITVVMVLAAAALGGPADGLAAGIDQLAVGLALLFLGTLGLPMTLRLLPHVVEASVAAGTGAAVASRVRRSGGQALTAIPHPAAALAGAAATGRPLSAAARLGAARPRPVPAPRPAPARSAASTTGPVA